MSEIALFFFVFLFLSQVTPDVFERVFSVRFWKVKKTGKVSFFRGLKTLTLLPRRTKILKKVCLLWIYSDFDKKKLVFYRPGVNFTNVKRVNFSYEHWFWQLFSSYKMTFVKKICEFNVDEIDTSCQFHQHFTSNFWAKILLTKT